MSLNTGNAILSNAITVDSSYNVGIGQASPSYKLDVTGTGRTTTGTYLATSSGNVGIGTTSPAQKLQVDSTTGDGCYLSSFQTTTGAADTGPILAFGFYDGTNNRDGVYIKGLKENSTSGNYASYLSFFTRPAGSGLTEKMRITSSGNVGIGTSSPGYKLEVNGIITGKAAGNGGRFETIDSNNNTNLTLNAAFNTGEPAVQTQSNSPILFAPNNTERMRIRSDGNVIIGAGSGYGTTKLCVRGADLSSSNYALYLEDSTTYTIFHARNDGNINMGTRAVSPYNYSTTGRSLVSNSNGDIGYTSSTRESKSNIESINDISWINQLRPVYFNYRIKDSIKNEFTDDTYDDKSFGLIADEVEAVNPDFVFYDILEDGSKKLAGVKYESMTAILIKAVQELSAKVSALENKP